MARKEINKLRPMNVYVAQDSSAEKVFRARSGVPGLKPEVRVPGIPATPEHDLLFHGGKTISNLTFHNFYIGGGSSWKDSDVRSIDQALSSAMSDTSLNNVIVQYFGEAGLASQFASSEFVSGTHPSVVSQADVESLLGALYLQGKLSNFDFRSTVFNFLLPSGTVLNTDTTPSSELQAAAHQGHRVLHDEDDSLHGLGGYHGSVHITGLRGALVGLYYAVGVFSEVLSDGRVNGIPVFDEPWKNVVATFYHELNEARTDPDVEDAIRAGDSPSAVKFLGWMSRQGEECGDFPVFEAKPLTKVFQEIVLTDGSGKVPIQFQYSNSVHGPEGPIPAPHTAQKISSKG
jgi:hypothetical protein